MTTRTTTAIALIAVLAGSLATQLAAQTAAPVLPAFDAANFAAPKVNPYFPLLQGVSQTLQGTRVDDPSVIEHGVLTVFGPGPEILGVATTTVLDEAFEGGTLVERTFDYYAADNVGNIWYFGEDVTNYRYDDAGKLTGTDTHSAWKAGVHGAKPGISVSGQPEVGLTLFQEHAPADEAMDYAEILAVDLKVTGPAGTFTDVMKTYEASTVDPSLREYKYYAPGVGMIRADEELSEQFDNPMIVVEIQP